MLTEIVLSFGAGYGYLWSPLAIVPDKQSKPQLKMEQSFGTLFVYAFAKHSPVSWLFLFIRLFFLKQSALWIYVRLSQVLSILVHMNCPQSTGRLSSVAVITVMVGKQVLNSRKDISMAWNGLILYVRMSPVSGSVLVSNVVPQH